MLLDNLYIDEDNIDFYDTLKRFAHDKVFSSVLERDESKKWDDALWQEVCKADLAGLTIPVQYGGQGAGCYQGCLGGEAMVVGSGDGGFMLSWGANFLIGAMPIVLFGSESQKKKFLPSIANGTTIAGLGLTEPSSGSDAASMLTFAREVEDGFILNGSKMFITNGSIGKVFVIMARTKKSRGPLGVSAFIVESNRKGFSVGKTLRKLGHNTSSTSELIFEEMFIPHENLLGPLHSGFMRIGRATLEWERAALGAGNIGSLQFILEETYKYAKVRHQFGKAIIEFYAIREKIARTFIFLQASRRLVYHLAREKDKDKSLPLLSSAVKLITSEMAEICAHDGVQILGGYGYMKEYHLERVYRDIKLATIGGGTSEVQRNIIAATFKDEASWQEMKVSLGCDSLQYKTQNHELTVALEIIALLDELICSTYTKIKSSKSQCTSFAFADCVAMQIMFCQALADLKIENVKYSKSAKERDLYLLVFFIVGMYASSIKTLASLESDVNQAKHVDAQSRRLGNSIFKHYLAMHSYAEFVNQCIDE